MLAALERQLSDKQLKSYVHTIRGTCTAVITALTTNGFTLEDRTYLQKVLTDQHRSSLASLFSTLGCELPSDLCNICNQIFLNAIKHGKARPTVTINEDHNMETIRIIIHNRIGPGGTILSPEQIDAINLGLQTGSYDGKAVSTSGSLGIGMTEIIETVRAYNGSLTIENSMKKGTTFTITIPFHSMKKATLPEADYDLTTSS
ncbi:MAG: ATP-binding protein [Candidatus Absconditabacterales bacterium]|nr:ATP-binding protein [Candidatus Absconditabacterales bacterium]